MSRTADWNLSQRLRVEVVLAHVDLQLHPLRQIHPRPQLGPEPACLSSRRCWTTGHVFGLLVAHDSPDGVQRMTRLLQRLNLPELLEMTQRIMATPTAPHWRVKQPVLHVKPYGATCYT